METRASYILVGSFALVFVIGIVVALLWISGRTGEEKLVYFDILFEGSVAGLRPGNPVNYRGVPIGQVVHMMIDPEDINKIRVTIEVPQTTPVKEDTIARLQYQGITGVAFVNLGGGTQEAPMMVAGSSRRGEQNPVINSEVSGLQKVFESAPELVSRLTTLVDNANYALRDENQKAFSDILNNLADFTGALGENKEAVGSFIDDGAESMANLRTITGDLAARSGRGAKAIDDALANLNELLEEAKPLVVDADIAVQEYSVLARDLQNATEEVTGLVSENRENVKAFTDNGLLEITLFMSEARQFVGSLQRVVDQLERDPARFLFGDQQQGFKAQQ